MAREGLIIISLLFLAVVFFGLDKWQSEYKSTPRVVNDQVAGNTDSTEVEKLSNLPDKALFDIAGIPISERPFSQRIPFNDLGFVSLFVLYPLYLLVKFLIWAIRTVRE